MKHVAWALLLVVALLSQSVKADSVRHFKITRVSISFFVNDGAGDNASFSLKGPGTSIAGFGGTGCFAWCGLFTTFAPGSSITPNIPFMAMNSLSRMKVGGHTFDAFADSSNMSTSLIVALKGFKFPAGAVVPSFTVHVPAKIPIPWNGVAGTGADFLHFRLNLPPAQLVLTFKSGIGLDGSLGYQFASGRYVSVVTPETGTLALVALGLGCLAALLRRRLHNRKSYPLSRS